MGRTRAAARSRRGCRTARSTSATAARRAVDVPVTGTHGGRALRRPELGLDHDRGRHRAGARARRPAAKVAAPALSGDREGRRDADRDRRHVDGHAPRSCAATAGSAATSRRCTTIAGATGTTYDVTAADVDASLRVVVSAGNWISSVGQAVSAKSDKVPEPPVAPRAAARHRRRAGAGGAAAAAAPAARAPGKRELALTRVRMSPRRFPVAHRKLRRGTRLDGSTITWRLNRSGEGPAQVPAGAREGRPAALGEGRRDQARGPRPARTSSASAGASAQRLLAPGRYRLVVTAKHGRQRSGPGARAVQGGARMSDGGTGQPDDDRPRLRPAPAPVPATGRRGRADGAGHAARRWRRRSCCCARRTRG